LNDLMEVELMASQLKTPTEPSIAPHEGRELDLMLDGRKPMALFYAIESEAWIIPEEEFAFHVQSGDIIKAEFSFKPRDSIGPTVRCVLYALPSETARIPQAVEILRPVFEELKAPNDQQERVLGRLLGYTEDDINVYMG
jgi:hypothetical protein